MTLIIIIIIIFGLPSSVLLLLSLGCPCHFHMSNCSRIDPGGTGPVQQLARRRRWLEAASGLLLFPGCFLEPGSGEDEPTLPGTDRGSSNTIVFHGSRGKRELGQLSRCCRKCLGWRRGGGGGQMTMKDAQTHSTC